MGKATIISGGTNGQYSVQINLNRAKVTAAIAQMTANIATLDGQISAAETLITAKEAEIVALQNQIALYANDPAHLNDLKTASTNLVVKTNELEALNITKNTYSLQKKALELRIAYLNANTSTDPTASAWCADLTEDLTGEVGTIEVPGERGTTLIRPGYDGGAVYSATRDGQLFPALCQDPAQLWYNYALLPGWQKWLPTYRFGSIVTIDYDNHTCSVTLEAAQSSVQSMDINNITSLSDVSIEYMT
jgi:sulfur transfer complex TusBCD TusB component (DsrH family)